MDQGLDIDQKQLGPCPSIWRLVEASPKTAELASSAVESHWPVNLNEPEH